ncbi:MAG TPA: hypothetical protein VF201_14025 [Nitrolancea sp.]
MTQPAERFQPDATRHFSALHVSYASRLGTLVDTVLRGLDRILGGFARPALQPVPARVPTGGTRRRA